MAILFCDSCEHYTTASYKYPSPSSVSQSSTGGRNDGASIRLTNGSRYQYYAQISYPASINTAGAAFRIRQTSFADPDIFFSFMDTSTVQVSLNMDTSGHIIALKGDNSTVLATSTNAMEANVLYHVEVKAYFHATAGTLEVRVNGSSSGWINLTDIDTQESANASANIVRFSCSPVGYRYFCDIVGWDTTGTPSNFIGEVNVSSLFVTAAGTYAQWTPSEGSNYTCVDEAATNNTDYVSSSTDAQIDSYNFGNIPSSATAILAAVNTIMVQKNDAGTVYVKSFCKSSTTEVAGSSQIPAISYGPLQTVYGVDPNTSAAWTQSGINAAEFGFKYSST